MYPDTFGRQGDETPRRFARYANTFGSGLPSGTLLLTQDGEIPVEFVTPGDRVITRNGGLVRLEEVSRFCRTLRAISFAAGSLGHTRPDQDLTLPADQPVLIRDWRAPAMFGRKQALVAARDLVDGEFVRDMGPVWMVVHQLHFSTPHVVYAGGLELGCGDCAELALQTAA